MSHTQETRRGPRINERLMVLCWCGAEHGFVSADEIRAGRTFSCGPRCDPERFGL